MGPFQIATDTNRLPPMGSERDVEWLRKKDGLKRRLELSSIRHEDIALAKCAFDVFRGTIERDVKEPYSQIIPFVAMVAAYGRIFCGRLSLDDKAAREVVPTDDWDLHQQILRVRHEAVAHSDYAFRSVRLVPVAGDRVRCLVTAARLDADLDHLDRLLTHVKGHFHAKVDEDHEALMAYCGRPAIPKETALGDF